MILRIVRCNLLTGLGDLPCRSRFPLSSRWQTKPPREYITTSDVDGSQGRPLRIITPAFVGQQAPIAAGTIRKGKEDVHGTLLDHKDVM